MTPKELYSQLDAIVSADPIGGLANRLVVSGVNLSGVCEMTASYNNPDLVYELTKRFKEIQKNMSKSKVNQDWFKAEIARRLSESGATTEDGAYPLKLETRCGTLLISPEDGWIACKFLDIKAALKRLGRDVNKFSGKWNHHYSDETFTTRIDTSAAVEEFLTDLSLICD